MKKKAASKSAFPNQHILIGLFIVLADVFLALASIRASSEPLASVAQAQQKLQTFKYASDPLVPPLFDCSKIHEVGIDKQTNLRAGALTIFCGEAQGGSASPADKFSRLIQQLLPSALAYGTTDINLITGMEMFPHITQATTFTAGNPDNPMEIIVAYVDTRGRNADPINLGGASVSTDGGSTFLRLTKANGQSPFDNTLGGPVVLYNKSTGTWFTVWLDAGCGGDQGLGGYKSSTPWDPNSWTHYCIHTSSLIDDRASGWVDNNPSSPFYGRMYVSWNDYGRDQAMFVRYSTDNGLTWDDERQVTTMRDVNAQMTGDLATGDVYLAAMVDMGGGFTNRANKIYRSTDGGNSWALTYFGPTFPAPGRLQCPGYWPCMYPR